jgi:hypothetical protein
MGKHRSSLPRFLAVIAVVVAVAAVSYGCGASIQRGKVLFGTDYPTADSKCAPAKPVTTVSSTTSVYATYVFKAQPGSEVVTITITKDGQAFGQPVALPTADSQGLDCFADTTDLSTLSGWTAGSYDFKMTSPSDTVAEGTLTIS